MRSWEADEVEVLLERPEETVPKPEIGGYAACLEQLALVGTRGTGTILLTVAEPCL